MEQKQWGITQLYNEYFYEPSSRLDKLHQQLDKLVMRAYGFTKNDDILAKFLDFGQNKREFTSLLREPSPTTSGIGIKPPPHRP